KAEKKRFEKLQAEREAEVSAKQSAFQEKQRSYQQRLSVLSEEKRLEAQRELARARDDFEATASNADRDLQRAYQSALLEIVAKIAPVVTDYAQATGYDFVFEVSQVEFALDVHDITDALIAKMNEVHPAR
ncbi:MAG: OmpH family outer membrane protein, partial [Acidobacteriota bacterium]